MSRPYVGSPSALVFGPQSKKPQPEYLKSIRTILCCESDLSPLVKLVRHLPSIWKVYLAHNGNLSAVTHAAHEMQALSDWIKTGACRSIAASDSGITSFPLMTIIQAGQYFHFLRQHGLSHRTYINSVRDRGGIQGYCTGLLLSASVACSDAERDLVENLCRALRLAVGLGAYSDLAALQSTHPFASKVVRFREEGQLEKILKSYTELYVSATIDRNTITLSGPESSFRAMESDFSRHLSAIEDIHLTCKVHSPDNVEIAKQLSDLCMNDSSFRLPEVGSLDVEVLSNSVPEPIDGRLLTSEIIVSILTCCCRWHDLLVALAKNLSATGQSSHSIVLFGLGDCVPLGVFKQAGLSIKIESMFPTLSQTTLLPTLPNDYTYPEKSVAIVGMACRFPGANDVEKLWDVILNGISRAEEVPKARMDIHQDSRDTKATSKKRFFGNFLSDIEEFDNAFFKISAREALSMDPQQRLLLETAYHAMESSGYLGTHRREYGHRVGVYIGASFVDYLEHTLSHPSTAYTSTGTIRAFLCGRISYYFGWTGPAEVIDTACSSSLVAICRAVKAICAGECSMALAGGVNLMSTPTNFLDLAKAGFLSPTGQCKPFDDSADGYCRAEGVGLVVLKDLSEARGAGDNILGVIGGAQSNQGGLSSALTVPSYSSQVALYQDILKQAGLQGHEVSYVEAHGTGTQAGDPLEIASIRQVFGGSQRSTDLNVGSVKGNIGHCETAAGVAGLIKGLLMMNKGWIPPMASFKRLNRMIPSLEPDRMRIPVRPQKWDASFRAMCVNSYGAAGSNAAVLICQAPSKARGSVTTTQTPVSYPIRISASSKQSVLDYATLLIERLSDRSCEHHYGSIARSLAQRPIRQFNWTAVCSGEEHLNRTMQHGLKDIWETSSITKKVILAFSGQVRKFVGLEESIYKTCHVFREHFDRCNNALMSLGYSSLLPSVFRKQALSDVVSLQCGIFAAQYACAKSWMDSGLHVDAVIGHSFGELTALVVSGILTLEAGLQIIATRALLMETKWSGDRGTMAVVNGTADEVQALIHAQKLGTESVEIACFNAFASQVLVGSESAMSKFRDHLKIEPRRFTYRQLEVTHGFHSRLTDPILEDLDVVAASMEFHRPTIYLESCTAQPQDVIGPSRISEHTRQPVYFDAAVSRLETCFGPSLWLEAGFDGPIIPMLKKAVKNPGNHSFQAIGSVTDQDFLFPLSTAIAAIWKQGISVRHWNFHSSLQSGLDLIMLPPYVFERRKHWLPYISRVTKSQVRELETSMPTSAEVQRKLITTGDSARNYHIDTTCSTFVNHVSGHTVAQSPLCPLSMYLECTTMAASLLAGQHNGMAVSFQNIEVEAALGLDPNREVSLDFPDINCGTQGMVFSITSKNKSDSTPKALVHIRGEIGFIRPDDQSEESGALRFIQDHINIIATDLESDKLRKDRAYGLFSRVVKYDPAFKGIVSIEMSGLRATAQIEVPLRPYQAEESTVGSICDTITLDIFVQVSGLLINSSKHCSEDEVFVVVGVKNFFISSSCDFQQYRSYTVYTSAKMKGEGRAEADISVVNVETGSLATIFTGVKLSKFPLERLKNVLRPISQRVNKESTSIMRITAPKIADRKTLSAEVSPKENEVDSGYSTAALPEEVDTTCTQSLRELLASFVDLPDGPIPDNTSIGDLGIDSLGLAELGDSIRSTFSVEIDLENLLDSTYGTLRKRIGIPTETKSNEHGPVPESITNQLSKVSEPEITTFPDKESFVFEDLIEALSVCEQTFDAHADKRSFSGYSETVAPEQDKLTLIYIAEAFQSLGVNLWELRAGATIPHIETFPKYRKLVERLWAILERLAIVDQKDSKLVRTAKPLSRTSSKTMLDNILEQYPAYDSEIRLMAIMGSKLADFLKGKANPVNALFSNPNFLKNYYNESPMLSTSTDSLIDVMQHILGSFKGHTLRILEVGGGFGGTTTRFCELLDELDLSVQYTFTDVSENLIRNAKVGRFSHYSWIDFQKLDLEDEKKADWQGKFDIVLGTNVVHATSDIVRSCKRIKSFLREGGFMLLSEVTAKLDWFDLVFGLLDGWWLATDDRDYPLQPVDCWIKYLRRAGFNNVAYSGGLRPEAKMQRLIIGSTALEQKSRRGYDLKSFAYKKADGVDIMADVYIPIDRNRDKPLPIALMIHGGGFMTFSRSVIRPWQTTLLLQCGFLPISLDHRLCPEVNLRDGAMTDIRDGIIWARQYLPTIARDTYGIIIDPDQVVVLGWSTGATLAMSTAWTVPELGMKPPQAILSFYGPTDFEAEYWSKPRSAGYPSCSKTTEEIARTLFPKPVSSYDFTSKDPELGGLNRDDPRSQLVFHTFHSPNAVSIFTKGLAISGEYPPLDPSAVQAISPRAQVRMGRYNVPTFIVHGDQDEVVPLEASVNFTQDLRSKGGKCELLVVKGKPHCFDVLSKPGSETWTSGVVPGYQFLVNTVHRR